MCWMRSKASYILGTAAQRVFKTERTERVANVSIMLLLSLSGLGYYAELTEANR